MSKERVAFSCILGVLGGLVLTNTGSDGDELFLFWLIYAVTCGVIVNTPKGLPSRTLLLSSWQSPVVLTLAMLFRVYFQGRSTVSSIKMTGSLLDVALIAVIFIASVFAIWIFAHSRPLVVRGLRWLFGMKEDRARTIEGRLAWVVRVLGTLGLIAQLVLG